MFFVAAAKALGSICPLLGFQNPLEPFKKKKYNQQKIKLHFQLMRTITSNCKAHTFFKRRDIILP